MTIGNEMQYIALAVVGLFIMVVSLGVGFFLGWSTSLKNRMNAIKVRREESKGANKIGIGAEFFNWLKVGLLNGNIKNNHLGARVFFVDDGILILAPYIFEDFIRQCNHCSGKSPKHVQNRFIKYLENKQSMVRTAVGLATHTYEFKAGNSSNLLNGYLIPKHMIFNEGSYTYEVCIFMQNISGFHIKTKALERTQPKEVSRLKAV